MNLLNMVVMAWAVYLRRQEIHNLRMCDLTWTEDSLKVWVHNTKNDKQGEGHQASLRLQHAKHERRDDWRPFALGTQNNFWVI